MVNQDKKGLLLDIMVVLMVSLGIFTAFKFVPSLALLVPITAVPFAYMMVKHGKGYFWATLLWYCTGVWINGNADLVMVMGLIAGINGYALGMVYEKQVKPSKAILVVGLSSLAIILILSQASMLASGVGFSKSYADSAHKFVQIMMAQPQPTGSPYSAMVHTNLVEFDKSIDTFLVKVIPGCMILISMFWGCVVYMVSRWSFRKVGIQVPPMEKLSNFNYPASVIPGTLGIVAVVYLASYTMQMDVDVAVNNLMLLLIYFFAVQGAAATARFFNRIKNGQVLSFITITLLLLTWVIFLSLIGLVSLFRKGLKVES